MENFRSYNSKLASLKSMRRVTLAMKMVSATKLTRAQQAQEKSREYNQQLRAVFQRVCCNTDVHEHPLLLPRKTVNNVLILIITSDRGLCAGFNNNLIKAVRLWLAEKQPKVRNLRASFCGRRGYQFFKNRVEVRYFYEQATLKPGMTQAMPIARDLARVFLEHKYDEIYLAYNRYVNPLTQTPVIEKILPLTLDDRFTANPEARKGVYLFEPDETGLMDVLLQKAAAAWVYYALVENAAGEHGARMTAMDNAVNNIDKLVDNYNLLRNRARQSSITNELMEIISGAESLK